MPGLKEILDNITDIPPLKQPGTVLSKHERLKSYYHTLEISMECTNAEEALAQINTKLEEIEDFYSGIEKVQKPTMKYDGRMYPVMEDNIVRQNGRIIAKTSGNDIIIENNGSYIIFVRGTNIELFKKIKHEN
ncbi:hypothetical protein [Flavobacterium sp. 245]|uniref:hypothetical protein n=1 Tax=Flavobacterium sp. 245 TaxID=2512115 RepID=UPI00105F31E4|nr:hypothetical protein [Flavobacterium sp. 245]TDO96641.1 hypothetical protein EV145_111141 [Flavobacterium sp. 245]